MPRKSVNSKNVNLDSPNAGKFLTHCRATGKIHPPLAEKAPGSLFPLCEAVLVPKFNE
jgi:hypothetical protein